MTAYPFSNRQSPPNRLGIHFNAWMVDRNPAQFQNEIVSLFQSIDDCNGQSEIRQLFFGEVFVQASAARSAFVENSLNLASEDSACTVMSLPLPAILIELEADLFGTIDAGLG